MPGVSEGCTQAQTHLRVPAGPGSCWHPAAGETEPAASEARLQPRNGPGVIPGLGEISATCLWGSLAPWGPGLRDRGSSRGAGRGPVRATHRVPTAEGLVWGGGNLTQGLPTPAQKGPGEEVGRAACAGAGIVPSGCRRAVGLAAGLTLACQMQILAGARLRRGCWGTGVSPRGPQWSCGRELGGTCTRHVPSLAPGLLGPCAWP